MTEQIKFVPVFPECPANAARCDLRTGVIEINQQMWEILPDYQKRYVLEHERGHYKGQTFSEVEADEYAFDQVKLKSKNSLWNYIKSVRNISHNDPERVQNATRIALQEAAKLGSKEAQDLLPFYPQKRQKIKWSEFANAEGGEVEIDLPEAVEVDLSMKTGLVLVLMGGLVGIIVGIVKNR